MSGSDLEDFSASATVIVFDHPIPLLRGPIPAGLSDDPSIGPFVLAFRDARSWKFAFRATESKLIEQCEAGARVGCSISASNKCKPPWWKTLLGVATIDFSERERCEECEMSACVAAAKESCIQFAKDKCLPSFREARIALATPKEPPFLSSTHPKSVAKSTESEPLELHQPASIPLSRCNLDVTNYRGSFLLDSSISIEGSTGETSCSERLEP
ncbi:uncharacterized protein LOC143877998 [Tasmannia lanceolata]|uniref:uncharacterized protein LOC143877998 n=1 Tax=Tasmannia lanceolata TaxID=3420 RepID=UPI0040629268